uniref:G_PROTEIN_RECEP_F1_2 domain-containing protein n=1 Tax=Meloidogyne hapla TaxID=6305 RepID=A0A1I8AY67_MELHA
MDAGITFQFLLPSIIYTLMGIIAILLNLSVCYITIKYRKQYVAFKSNTAILLIINSFFEILQHSDQFYYLFVAGSGANFALWSNAVFFQTHALIGFFASIFTFINMSIDRLIAVVFPLLYELN